MTAPSYNFAYLDEQTKRMIRRAILKAIAIPGYQVPFARAIRRGTSMPTMAVGLITDAKQAEAIVHCGDVDLVAMARAMLWNPRWPWHAAAILGAHIHAPAQYWRSAPREVANVIAEAKLGMR